jgi:endonuclease III
MSRDQQTVRRLLDDYGTTYARQAGITLRDKPSPLYQLLVLTMLSSARISADVAAATAHELFTAGWRTPQKMVAASWQQRVDALGRGGYRRYDESTSTKLEEGARHVLDEYAGDLRRIRPGKDGDADELRKAIRAVPRIGPVGAGIFCREVQAVWPELSPWLDRRALERAEALGLPRSPARLAELADGRVAELGAALVRSGSASPG